MTKLTALFLLGLVCLAAAATIDGSNASDNIQGTADADLIHGNDGNDNIYGKNGNDVIFGDDQEDTLYGDEGNDELHGGHGNDVIYGGSGDDVITGGRGDDRLEGGNGNDDVTTGVGGGRVDGGDGDDEITSQGQGVIYTGDGNDIVFVQEVENGLTIFHNGAGNKRIRFAQGFLGGNVVIEQFGQSDSIEFDSCRNTFSTSSSFIIDTESGNRIDFRSPSVFNRDNCFCQGVRGCPFGTNPATTGVQTTGVQTTGVQTTGVATTGVATTGVATTGVATTGVQTTGVQTTGVQTTGVQTTGVATTGVQTTGVQTTGQTSLATVCASTAALANSIEAQAATCEAFGETEADVYTGLAAAVGTRFTKYVVFIGSSQIAGNRITLNIRELDLACPATATYRLPAALVTGAANTAGVYACADRARTLTVSFYAQDGTLVELSLLPTGGTTGSPALAYTFDSNVAADFARLQASLGTTETQATLMARLLSRPAGSVIDTPGSRGSSNMLGCTCTGTTTPVGNVNGIAVVEDNQATNTCHTFYIWQNVNEANNANKQIASRPFVPCCGGCTFGKV